MLRKLFLLLDRRGRIQFFLLPLPMLLVSLLEMASIGMIVPVLQVAVTANQGAGVGQSPFGDLMGAVATRFSPVALCIAFVLLFLVKNVGILGMTYAINRFTLRKTAAFSQQLFGLYLDLPYAIHLQRNSAELLRNLTQTAANAFQGYRLLLNLALEAFLAISALAVLLLIEPKVTIGLTVAAAVFALLIYRVLGPYFTAWGKQTNDLQGVHIRLINQSLGAIKDVKIHHAEPYLSRLFGLIINGIVRAQLLNGTAQEAPRLVIEFVVVGGFSGVVLIFMASGRSGEEIVALLGLFGMAAMRLMPSFNRLLANMNNLRFLHAHIDTLHQEVAAARDAREKISVVDDGGDISFEHEMRLEHLSYRYANADKDAVRDANLAIRKGERIGIVGPSGAGKSTLVDLILGLLVPTEGRILVDGNDVAGERRAWQSRFGYVPQDVYLLDDTVRRNIAFGMDDDKIDGARVQAAVQRAHLAAMVSGLPHGLDTVVGERGSRLSGGERQRMGIARALYSEPEILVFDEATSALDNVSENEIRIAINELARAKTVVIIAHRLSTVRECDRIVFVDSGRISAVGDFQTLARESPEFQQLLKMGEIAAQPHAVS